jgi:hypothetical protein
MPPTPESQGSGWWEGGKFDAKEAFERFEREPRFMSFQEGMMMFHPEDRRHFWLCDKEDDPAAEGREQVEKTLYVDLKEHPPQSTACVNLGCFLRKLLS